MMANKYMHTYNVIYFLMRAVLRQHGSETEKLKLNSFETESEIEQN